MRQLTLTMFAKKSLLEMTAERVKRFMEKHSPERLYVFYSGGKDSTAALAAVVYAGDSILKRVIVVYNELVGNTLLTAVRQSMRILEKLGLTNVVVVESPPYHNITRAVLSGRDRPLVLHIRAYSRLGLDFWDTVARYGVPIVVHSGQRYCYNEFKEKHWRALPVERGYKRFVVVGVKATDSNWRAKRWKNTGCERIFEWRDGSKRIVLYALAPVCDMTSDEVWGVLREAGLDKMLETYWVYGDSMNCSLCPLRSIKKQAEIIKKLALSEEGREILRRALEALRKAPKKPGTKTAEIAEKWMELIEEALSNY